MYAASVGNACFMAVEFFLETSEGANAVDGMCILSAEVPTFCNMEPNQQRLLRKREEEEQYDERKGPTFHCKRERNKMHSCWVAKLSTLFPSPSGKKYAIQTTPTIL